MHGAGPFSMDGVGSGLPRLEDLMGGPAPVPDAGGSPRFLAWGWSRRAFPSITSGPGVAAGDLFPQTVTTLS
jgi:hypothetical protein